MIAETVENNIDNLSKEELEALAAEYDIMSNKYTAYEQAVKLSLNSIVANRLNLFKGRVSVFYREFIFPCNILDILFLFHPNT